MENNLELKYNKLIYNYPYLKEIVSDCDESDVCTAKSLDEKIIYGIVKNGHTYYLDSKYSVDNECEHILRSSKAEKNPFAVFIIFGLGNGMLVRKIRERFPDNYIYVHEPSEKIFHKFMETVEDIDFIIDEHVVITVGEKTRGARIEVLHEMVDINNFYITDVICMPQYRNLMIDDYLLFLNDFYARIEQIIMQKNTDIAFNGEHIENFWHNILDLIDQYGVKDLIKNIENENKEGYPAFIVSAGPSLDKNIDMLKEVKGRGMIMAVDTAIKPLLKKGIVPDIVASVDPHKPLELFQYRGTENLPMLVDINYNSKIDLLHNGKRFYTWSGAPFVKEFLEKMGIDLGVIESGGSVACNLFSLAIMSKFETIVLIGQDLAYPNKKGHSSASYDSESNIDIESGKYFKVEDIYGNHVYTEGNMNAYRKWFEATISRNPSIRFIDATEGGAKIKGTEIMTLSSVINECCNKLSEKNWIKIVNDCPKLMNKEQRKQAIEIFGKMPQNLEYLKEMLDDGMETIERIRNNKGELENDEIKKSIQEIMEINSVLQDSLEAKILGMYNAETGYTVAMSAYRVKEDIKSDVDDIVKMCEMSYKGYLQAIENMQVDYNNYIDLTKLN